MGAQYGIWRKEHLLWGTIWAVDKKGICYGAQYGSWIQKGHLLWGTIWAVDKKSTCYGAQYGLWIRRVYVVVQNTLFQTWL